MILTRRCEDTKADNFTIPAIYINIVIANNNSISSLHGLSVQSIDSQRTEIFISDIIDKNFAKGGVLLINEKIIDEKS